MLSWNPEGHYPKIEDTSYVHSTAVIIGNVKIGEKVFVGPGAVLRADEPGSSIVVQDNCNIQDRVIIHCLGNSAVLIKENTSLSHGSIVHGPCVIRENCFIGFGSVVFGADIGRNVIIKHSVVVEKVEVPEGKLVDSGEVINKPEQISRLMPANQELKDFAKNVVNANLDLVNGYLR